LGRYRSHVAIIILIFLQKILRQDFEDFTFDRDLFPEARMATLAKNIHEKNQRMVLILDPAIKAQEGYWIYDTGVKEDVFIKDKNDKIFVGKVWPGLTAFPDFLAPQTWSWWQTHITEWIKRVPIDGIWIDMNEPASFCDGACGSQINRRDAIAAGVATYNATRQPHRGFDPNHPPYAINNLLSFQPLYHKNVDMACKTHDGTIAYDTHNLYGVAESHATRNAQLSIEPQKRPFLLSRSTMPASGQVVGHWLGDNAATWNDLKLSIAGSITFQIFGIPYVGPDICGFIGDTTEELCARWMAVGAFYPFSRNHKAIDTTCVFTFFLFLHKQ
jgi:alpha-glucosidase